MRENISSIRIYKKNDCLSGNLFISGSKSISNRLLILKALYKKDIYIKNISNCEDTIVLKNSLESNGNTIDIHHAGTAMRFLTSYLSIIENKTTVLTGSDRMKNRPISILVESLRSLGAKINYLEKSGYPPIKIFGRNILGGEIHVDARVSSQYISSLMLIASKFKKGLKIFLQNKITSVPYIKMTFDLLISAGIKINWKKNTIHIFPGKNNIKKYFNIESDWSSASYYYSIATIAKNSNIILNSYYNNSLQGDREVSYIYDKHFGISTQFNGDKIFLFKKKPFYKKKIIELDLNKTPDIAQTIAVTCAAIGVKCNLKGLETLKIKETDRLKALKNELIKFGIITEITNSCFKIKNFTIKNKYNSITINTYQDHRMAMSFAPFALLKDYYNLYINDPCVVNKSYPNFWNDLKSIGFVIETN
ncbi:3-phosphoshikimate 1-carboxyvinyltransferase [Blattabacterium cuenoti]|uniref:3-phosphoshikimate 1-carboxyvinyltransferase n=1 Tax=Blattabacterium cuenoti TaxID=1653831 RepID=UPI00163C2117|nr:3-phosphoshikimate 1-carboxyvinyltransferase [Blattabacterium cuenoti]